MFLYYSAVSVKDSHNPDCPSPIKPILPTCSVQSRHSSAVSGWSSHKYDCHNPTLPILPISNLAFPIQTYWYREIWAPVLTAAFRYSDTPDIHHLLPADTQPIHADTAPIQRRYAPIWHRYLPIPFLRRAHYPSDVLLRQVLNMITFCRLKYVFSTAY